MVLELSDREWAIRRLGASRVIGPPVRELMHQHNMRLWGRQKTMPPEGIVYLLTCGEYLKLGHTRRPLLHRLAQYQSHNPFPVHVLAVKPASVEDEQLVHAELQAHLHMGEWYRMAEPMLQWAKGYFPTISNLDLGADFE